MITFRTIRLLLIMVLGGVALGGCTGQDAYDFQGTEYDPPNVVALDMIDQNGKSFSLENQEGKVVVVYFGYTTCPDICPTTLTDFGSIKGKLGDDAADVEFVMVTVDPERDTAGVLKKYLGFFDPDFIGLWGDEEQTQIAENAFGVTAMKVDQPDSATGYLVNHTSRIFVVDTEGRLRLTYTYGFDPDLIAQDIEHLL